MAISALPLIENWYLDADTDRTFRVVALDEAADTVEVQYFNGDLGEYDLSSWYASRFTPIEPPEDWSAPFDDLEADDLGYTDPDIHEPDRHDLSLDDLLNEEDEGLY